MKLLLFLILASVFVSSISLSYAEEITPKYPIMKNFPYDSQKGVEHYLERYYSETIYKTWFHNNFNGTIEEVVGLTKSQEYIKNRISECNKEAREVSNQYARDNYMNWNADIYALELYDKFLFRCTEASGIQALNNAGVILAGLGFHKAAIVQYDIAIDIHHAYAIATANKATSLFELGEFEESEKMFDRALMLDPQNKEIIMLDEAIKNEIKQNPKKYNSIQTTSNDIICGTGTIYKDGQCIVDHSSSKSLFSKGGGCLIATATYGSELAPQVQQLRELRDNKLLNTELGTSFINSFNNFYYSFSPVIADYERENPVFKEMIKVVITPMITSLSILNYVDMDSEAEVSGYGISLIMLNVMMYVGIPAVVIVGISKKF